MQTLFVLFHLFIFLIFTGCQAKQGASDIISDHVPALNRFTLNVPSTKTYVANETITLTVSFPFDLIIDTAGGSPPGWP